MREEENRKRSAIGSHPGGLDLTRRLLALAGAAPPGRALDLGAGAGETVAYLRELGFAAAGVDAEPKGTLVERQDMTRLSFEADSFDVCLAECSLSECGDGERALAQIRRVLRPGGSLLVSDVFFRKESAPAMSMKLPLTRANWERIFADAGFRLCAWEDETALWRQFFFESLWNGNADESCDTFFREAGKAGCGYFLAWLKKEERDGLV